MPIFCIAVVTTKPLSSWIAFLALGTGDLDYVYHFALPELRESAQNKIFAPEPPSGTMPRRRCLGDDASETRAESLKHLILWQPEQLHLAIFAVKLSPNQPKPIALLSILSYTNPGCPL